MLIHSALHRFARVWPLNRGRDAFMRHALPHRPFSEYLGSLPEWTLTREGFHLRTNAGLDYTSLALKLWGDFEPHTKRFLLREVRPGSVFLDLGANVGYFSLFVALEMEVARVIAFEPNPEIAARLRDSVEANGSSDRVQVVEKALSDSAGEVSFGIDPANSGHSRFAQADHENVITVQTVRLDDWLDQNAPGADVSVLKLDVEGAETQALRGMERLLARARPALIVEGLDDMLREFGSSLDEMTGLLRDLGFREVMPRYDGNTFWKHSSSLA